MKIKIVKGTNKVGGCITEVLSARGTKIIIDFGQDLDTQEKFSLDGLTHGDSKYDALLFTHYHGDHINNVDSINDSIPMYMGELAKQVYFAYLNRINGKGIHTDSLKAVERINTFGNLDIIHIGDIKITPYLTDHSAIDSYMFLIEADGKRVLHTGDFRDHGFRAELIDKMIDHIGHVDMIITEGTLLTRNDGKPLKTEQELVLDFVKIMEENKYVYVQASSTNFDRWLSANEAAKSLGKPVVVLDEYQLEMLMTVSKHKSAKKFDFSNVVRWDEYRDQKLGANGKGACIFWKKTSDGLSKGILSKKEFMDPFLVYSMWQGYLSGDNEIQSIKELWEMFPANKRCQIHTSGHASKQLIEKLINKLNAKKVTHIHGSDKTQMNNLNIKAKIIELKDGQVHVV